MADSSILKPYILKWEGGFVNDPADAGGATNKGITIATYEYYCRKKGLPKPTITQLKNISDAEWHDIFKSLYWDRWRADDIQSQKVANILVDWVWGSGVWGIKIPQRLLGVEQDGIVGRRTLMAVNFADPNKLFQAIFDARVKFTNDIVARSVARYEKRIGRKATNRELLKYTNKRFQRGWMNRINGILTI